MPKRGKGTLVLFHITPEATWSNLPISGSFVEMLRRIVQLSRNQGAATANAEGRRRFSGALPHDRRRRRAGAADAGCAATGCPAPAPLPVTIENPPGLYGTEEGVFAHNLLAADSTFAPLDRPQISCAGHRPCAMPSTNRAISKGALVAAALVLMVLDTLAVFWMGGLFVAPAAPAPRAATAAAVAASRWARCFGHADPPAPTMPSRAMRRRSRPSRRPASPM